MVGSRAVSMAFEFEFESSGHLAEVQILIQQVCWGGHAGGGAGGGDESLHC